jgi:hypothetical protein
MINKAENISVGVYWDDDGIPGWKLSGWLNTTAKIGSKNCEKYAECGTVSVQLSVPIDRHGLLSVAVCACARATAEVLGTYTKLPKYYHSNFSVYK